MSFTPERLEAMRRTLNRSVAAAITRGEDPDVNNWADHDETPEHDCTCFMTDPSTWERYGGAIEPGSVYEPNPECLACFPENTP